MPDGSKNPDNENGLDEILRDYELRYRIMSENLAMGIFRLTMDPDTRIHSANRVMAQMLGYEVPEDLIGKPFFDFLCVPEDMKDLAAGIQQSGFYSGNEMRLKRRDGSDIWVSVQAWRLGTSGNSKALIEGFAEDITEQKISEQEMLYHQMELGQYALALDRANRKLNLLASITRHDIINQLTALMIAIQLMDEQCEDEKLREYIGMQEEIANKIKDQILFTKDYHEIGVTSPIWYDVRKGIMAAAALLPHARNVLNVDASAEAVIYADPLIEKVFYNLIENALRHGDGMTRVKFSAYPDNGSFVIVCEDNGPGVPVKHKEDIFNRRYYRHTGFGLFLSREILHITGLSIRENGEEGKGARFEIRVPPDSYRPVTPKAG